jgi:hypothetical protein
MPVTSRSYERPHRPAAIAALNGLGKLLGRFGVQASLREASLVAATRRSTGLQHWGDEAFREPLRKLLDSVEHEARLHPLGRLMVRRNLIRILKNRLRMEAEFQLHPEILERRVEAPVFIVGLQRTGTTLLHRLLALEPSLRALATWEAINPASPPGRRAGRPDPRLRTARLAEQGLRYLAPDFFAIHPAEADAPEEDVLLFDYSFWTTVPEATQNVPSFSSWLEGADHSEAYRYYEKVIKLLLWQRPGRWLGKTPHHLEHLDTLLEVFPDAKIIQTHRDPTRVIASFCSMVSHARGIFSDQVDSLEVGHQWGAKAARMLKQAMAARARLGPEAFIDVAYADLLADPIGEVRRVCERIGSPLKPHIEQSMREWLADNPQHRYGRHRYALEDFGLDRETEERRFADYRARFQIPHE